jgi:DHA1 family multidrug resistance protein-like MFS transporter
MTRDFLLVIISLATWGIGESAFMYFQPLYLEELGASPLTIGGILGGVGLMMTIIHIPAGYLADRIGQRKLIWAGWLTGIITTGIMAAANSLVVFSIGIILYSVTLFVSSPLNSYVTASRGKLSVERALTTTTAAFYFGGIVGPLAGGMLAERIGLRSIYFVSFGIFILSTLIILFIRHQPPEQDHGNPARELYYNRRYMFYLPLVFLVFFTLFFPQPLAPNFLRNQREISFQTIGVLGSISSLGNVVLSLLFGYLPAQIGLILGHTMIGAFALLIWKTSQVPFLMLAYFLLGGFRATRSIILAQVSKLVKKVNLGLAYGITETVSSLAMAAAPPLAGYLYEFNPNSIFSTTLLLLIPTIIFIIIRKEK